jgi:hypothetical protein
MPYDLKKALGSVSKSKVAFEIYEGEHGMMLLISPDAPKIAEVKSVCGKGSRLIVKGKCSKNDDNEVVLKTGLPPIKKWTDGLKRAFATAGCSSTHFVIEEEGESGTSESVGERVSGPTPSSPQSPAPARTPPGQPPRSVGEKQASERESEPAPAGRARSGAVLRGMPTPPPPPGARKQPTSPSPQTLPGTGKPPTSQVPQRPASPAGATRPTPPPRTEDPQLEVRVQEHLALRKRLKPALTAVIANYNAEAAKLEERLAKAVEYTGQARNENPANTMQLNIFIDLVRDIAEEAETILTPVQNAWKERTKEGSDMMKARVDHKTLPSKWTPEQRATYERESNEAFGAYDLLQRQARKILEGMETKLEQITLTFEEAQSYSNQGQDPQVYVGRLTKMNQEIKGLGDYFKGKLSAADGALRALQADAEKPTIPQAQADLLRKKNDLAIEAQNVINARAERFDLMVKRVAAIPADYRTAPSVATPLKQFNDAAAILKANIAKMKANQTQVLAYLRQALAKPIAG